MTEPLDTSAIQQLVSQKETDADPSAAATNSFIINSSRSWSKDLPPFVVENIYLFLNRRDQYQMSMVCKNWAEEYRSPSIWRNFTFAIPSRNCSSDICLEVRRALTFGKMFHHVKIICLNYSSNLNKEISDQLSRFIEALTDQSQLLSFHIEITFPQLDLDQEVYEKIFRSILRFIQSQNKLKVIRFINTYLKNSEFIQILEELVIKKPITLKQLDLIGIMEDPYDITQDFFQNAQGFYDMLLNVELLCIDYSRIFERLILCIKCAIENNLPLRQKPICIKLLVNNFNFALYQGIESKSWEILSKYWPTLRVRLFCMVPEYLYFPFEKMIVKHMPLTYFECDRLQLLQFDNQQINYAFRHLILTEVCNFLEEMKITSKEVIQFTETENYVQNLKTLLFHCANLERFTAFVPPTTTSLEFVFNFIAANRIKNLKYFCLQIPCFSSSEEVLLFYSGVIKKYSIIMQEMGFKLRERTFIERNIAFQLDITCWKISAND